LPGDLQASKLPENVDAIYDQRLIDTLPGRHSICTWRPRASMKRWVGRSEAKAERDRAAAIHQSGMSA